MVFAISSPPGSFRRTTSSDKNQAVYPAFRGQASENSTATNEESRISKPDVVSSALFFSGLSGKSLVSGANYEKTSNTRYPPVPSEQVKAILKAWAPGVVEACSRADFSAAMGGIGGGERVSFERVCAIAAAVLGSTGGVSENRFPSFASVCRVYGSSADDSRIVPRHSKPTQIERMSLTYMS